jgi:uncharacterized protein (DUF433 family)
MGRSTSIATVWVGRSQVDGDRCSYNRIETLRGCVMTSVSNPQAAIIRTERGLAIAGTRITLYDVMDYLTAQYPLKFIRGLFNLTPEQMTAALDYINANRADVEAEYQGVLKGAEELRQYYAVQNHDLITQLENQPPQPGMEVAWQKLQVQKAEHNAKIASGS